MTERFAFLDLGTNTFNLLIIERTTSGLQVLHSGKIACRLGKGGITSGKISDDAFSRGIEAMNNHAHTIHQYGTSTIYAFATSMLRDASNSAAFCDEVKKQTGITIHIISGEREAELIWKGVRLAIPFSETSLIMDIGGGSTEFIIANEKEIFWKKSYPLGVTRLYEHFKHSDPILPQEVESIHNHISDVLSDLVDACAVYSPSTLIGSAGSFETYAEIISRANTGKPADFSAHGMSISLQQFLELTEQLKKSNHEERTNLDGLIELRRDLIVMASILCEYVILHCGIEHLRMTTFALKEGLMAEITGIEHL
jgi:exopolyphosphatase/guanosine-5'-triphosphate,3'-diphosphate pyrophosphatase